MTTTDAPEKRAAYFRSQDENNWYPHFVHNLDNLIRFGGPYPPIHVHADIRRTKLLGAAQVYEGGAMLVWARDDIFTMSEHRRSRLSTCCQVPLRVGKTASGALARVDSLRRRSAWTAKSGRTTVRTLGEAR